MKIIFCGFGNSSKIFCGRVQDVVEFIISIISSPANENIGLIAEIFYLLSWLKKANLAAHRTFQTIKSKYTTPFDLYYFDFANVLPKIFTYK